MKMEKIKRLTVKNFLKGLTEENISYIERKYVSVYKALAEYKQFARYDDDNCFSPKEFFTMLYIVFENAGAGCMWIEEVLKNSDWTYQQLGGSHANNISESTSKEECEKYIEEAIKLSTKYAVFQTRDMNGEECYFWSEMNCCSGTYHEVGGSYSTHILDFEKEEDARNYIESMHKSN